MKKLYGCVDINMNGESEHFMLTKKELKRVIKSNKKSGFKYEKLGRKGIVTYVTNTGIEAYI